MKRFGSSLGGLMKEQIEEMMTITEVKLASYALVFSQSFPSPCNLFSKQPFQKNFSNTSTNTMNR